MIQEKKQYWQKNPNLWTFHSSEFWAGRKEAEPQTQKKNAGNGEMVPGIQTAYTKVRLLSLFDK